MLRYILRDDQWARIKGLLPGHRARRPGRGSSRSARPGRARRLPGPAAYLGAPALRRCARTTVPASVAPPGAGGRPSWERRGPATTEGAPRDRRHCHARADSRSTVAWTRQATVAAVIRGVDACSATLDARPRPESAGRRRFANPAGGVAAPTAGRERHEVGSVVMEATGGVASADATVGRQAGPGKRPPFGAPRGRGRPAAVVDPRRVRRFAEAVGRPGKTGRSDAAVVVRSAEAPGGAAGGATRARLAALPAAPAHGLACPARGLGGPHPVTPAGGAAWDRHAVGRGGRQARRPGPERARRRRGERPARVPECARSWPRWPEPSAAATCTSPPATPGRSRRREGPAAHPSASSWPARRRGRAAPGGRRSKPLDGPRYALYPFLAAGTARRADALPRRPPGRRSRRGPRRHGAARPIADPRLMARRLALSQRVLAASLDYPARHGVPRSVVELGEHRGVAYTNHGAAGRRFAGRDGAGAGGPAALRRRGDARCRHRRSRSGGPADLCRRCRRQGG